MNVHETEKREMNSARRNMIMNVIGENEDDDDDRLAFILCDLKYSSYCSTRKSCLDSSLILEIILQIFF